MIDYYHKKRLMIYCVLKKLFNIHLDETIKWTQRANDKWVRERDANTKYFHTVVSRNFKKLIIYIKQLRIGRVYFLSFP
jgi:hypothetical protein